ncbi:expressed unknown protein [Seminavis robusta]|uniref:Uncharacterized protein n=1 Tax=Seminavis robusta TaxID=568900 RepID=A0A9N8DWP4_9STRA|nr:expressed unknown protein [Seminavis robusta]|eukprot:Sro433_g141870.1 n/a (113) ;mRNA; f:46264-46602
MNSFLPFANTNVVLIVDDNALGHALLDDSSRLSTSSHSLSSNSRRVGSSRRMTRRGGRRTARCSYHAQKQSSTEELDSSASRWEEGDCAACKTSKALPKRPVRRNSLSQGGN